MEQNFEGDQNIGVGINYGRITIQMSPLRPRPNYICQAPALPTYYVKRPKVLGELKQSLLRETIPGTVVGEAVYGLGGIGNSV